MLSDGCTCSARRTSQTCAPDTLRRAARRCVYRAPWGGSATFPGAWVRGLVYAAASQLSPGARQVWRGRPCCGEPGARHGSSRSLERIENPSGNRKVCLSVPLRLRGTDHPPQAEASAHEQKAARKTGQGSAGIRLLRDSWVEPCPPPARTTPLARSLP